MEPPSTNACRAYGFQCSQVTLYRWYLVKSNGSCDSAKVSIGGFLGTAGIERFETAAIVERLEKCRLLAQDGVEVRLAGLINDSTTVSNGFSVDLVQAFLSGFPYTWNHLLDKELNFSNTYCEDHQGQGYCGLGSVDELSQPGFNHCCAVQERNAWSSIQNWASSHHAETHNEKEPITERFMIGKAQAETEGQTLRTFTVSKDNENLVHSTVQDAHVDSSNCTINVEQGSFFPSDTIMEELQANALMDQSTNSAKEIPDVLQAKQLHMPDIDCVDQQGLEDAVLGSVAVFLQPSFEDLCSDQDMKAWLSTQNEVSCDHETLKESEPSTNQAMTKEFQAEMENPGFLTQALSRDNESTDELVVMDVLVNNSTLISNIEQDTFNACIEKLHAKAIGDGRESQAQGKHGRRARSCGRRKQEAPAITADCACNDAGEHSSHQLNQSPHNSRSRNKSNKYCAGSEGLQYIVGERRQSARIMSKKSNMDTVGGAKVQARKLSHYSEGIEAPFDVKAQRPGSLSTTASASLNFKDDHMISEDEITAVEAMPGSICAAEAEQEEVAVLETDSEALASSCSKRDPKNWKRFKQGSDDYDRSLSRHSRQYSMRPSVLPPLPCPRVLVRKDLVSTAFGLKTSRSGRLLVPPLAHWCGQSLLRDKDGGIIAISDGSKDLTNDSTGSLKFKRPPEPHLQRLQRRLYQAAMDSTSKSKTHKQKKD